MLGSGFQWVRPPSTLVRGIRRYERQVLATVHAVAAYVGQKMQDEGRANAPWHDRTGNARSGLFFAVDGFGLPTLTGQVSAGAAAQQGGVTIEEGDRGTLIVVFGHTVYYGKYLEMAHGQKYAIVMSTVERNLPVLERMMKRALS